MYAQPRAKPSPQLPHTGNHFEVEVGYHRCYSPDQELAVELSVDLHSQNHPSLPVLLWYCADGQTTPWPLEVMRLKATEIGHWFDQPCHLSFDIKQLPEPHLMPDGKPLTPSRLHSYVEDRGSLRLALQEIYLARLAQDHVKAKFTWFPVTDAKPTPHCLLILTCDPPEAQKWSVTLRLPAELEKLIRPL